MDRVALIRNIWIYPNQRPWMASQVQALLRARNAAFRSGDQAQCSVIRADLRGGIKDLKVTNRRTVEDHLADNISHQVWQGLKQLTYYNSSVAISVDASLAEELNFSLPASRQPLLKEPHCPHIP